jgi:homocysteine S-methyltransferase
LAGADIIETVTYQVHYMPLPGKENDLQRLRLEDGVVDKMLQDGVKLAREAMEQHRAQTGKLAHIAASIGSLGGALADGSEYTGRFGLSMEQVASFHKRKLQVLASEHPDVIAFETIPCILECEAVLSVLNEVKDECNDTFPPVWLSLACSDGEHLSDGSKILDALSKIDHMDPNANLVCAIGINCCSCNYGTYFSYKCEYTVSYGCLLI